MSALDDMITRFKELPPVTDAHAALNGSALPEPVVVAGTQMGGQVRLAYQFVAQHAYRLRYVHRIGWHVWSGRHWRQDEKRTDVQAALATLKKGINQLADLAGPERDRLYSDLKRLESASGIEGTLKIAGAIAPLSVAPSELDAHPYLFNTPGGTLDLRSGETSPNDRDDLITKCSGGSLDDDADSAELDKFLGRILPDAEIRQFVQRLFGYAMLGKVTEHVMPIFTGEGANGKGTLRDTVMSAFGDYAIEVDPALLMETKHERHGTFKMRLRGARLAFCSETEKGRRFAEATMKRLVGGDPIEANYMHKDPITFDPSHTLIMLTNHLPRVSGDDPAVWRRILVVPFDVIIPEEERDGELPERLKLASSAVLAWVWKGWKDYQEQGLNPPEAVRARTLAYQQSSDALARFIDERIIANPNAREKARDVFSAWTKWCVENGEQASTEPMFAESMGKRGFEKKRLTAGIVYVGLMLASDEDEPDDARR